MMYNYCDLSYYVWKHETDNTVQYTCGWVIFPDVSDKFFLFSIFYLEIRKEILEKQILGITLINVLLIK